MGYHFDPRMSDEEKRKASYGIMRFGCYFYILLALLIIFNIYMGW